MTKTFDLESRFLFFLIRFGFKIVAFDHSRPVDFLFLFSVEDF